MATAAASATAAKAAPASRAEARAGRARLVSAVCIPELQFSWPLVCSLGWVSRQNGSFCACGLFEKILGATEPWRDRCHINAAGVVTALGDAANDDDETDEASHGHGSCPHPAAAVAPARRARSPASAAGARTGGARGTEEAGRVLGTVDSILGTAESEAPRATGAAHTKQAQEEEEEEVARGGSVTPRLFPQGEEDGPIAALQRTGLWEYDEEAEQSFIEPPDDGQMHLDEPNHAVCATCLGRSPSDLWVACDACGQWHHQLCVGISEPAHVPEQYLCQACVSVRGPQCPRVGSIGSLPTPATRGNVDQGESAESRCGQGDGGVGLALEEGGAELQVEGRTRRAAAAAVNWSPGDRLLGKYRDGFWYSCTVEDALRDGRFVVTWDDGDENDRVKSVRELRQRLPAAGEHALLPAPAEERAQECSASRAGAGFPASGGIGAPDLREDAPCAERSNASASGVVTKLASAAFDIATSFLWGGKATLPEAQSREPSPPDEPMCARACTVSGAAADVRDSAHHDPAAVSGQVSGNVSPVTMRKRKERGGGGVGGSGGAGGDARGDDAAESNIAMAPSLASKRRCSGAEGSDAEARLESSSRASTRAASQRADLRVLSSHAQEPAPLACAPAGQGASVSERRQVGGPVRFRIGEVVEAWHKAGGWHRASIQELLADGSVKLVWADGDPTDRIKKRKKLRPISSQ